MMKSIKVGLRFEKRWGVPEGFHDPKNNGGWDVPGYDGPLGDDHYGCDGKFENDEWCRYERVVAIVDTSGLGPLDHDHELCRNHIPEEYRAAFDEFAETAETAFRRAGRSVCATNGHKPSRYAGDDNVECYCGTFFKDEVEEDEEDDNED